jgi:hypothetical protein
MGNKLVVGWARLCGTTWPASGNSESPSCVDSLTGLSRLIVGGIHSVVLIPIKEHILLAFWGAGLGRVSGSVNTDPDPNPEVP